MDFPFANTIYYFIGIALVIGAGVFGSAVSQLMGVRIQRPRFQLKDKSEIPAYLRPIYQDAVKQLTALGFEYHHCQLTHDFIAHEYAEKWSVVMVNRKDHVFAEISPASSFLDLPGFEVDFWSIAKDGTALITVNGRGHTILCAIPNAEIHDPMAASLADTLQSHIEEQSDVFGDKPVVVVNAASYVKLQQKLMDGYFLTLMNEGGLISTGNNTFRLTFAKARRLSAQLLKGNKRLKKLMRERLRMQQKEKASGNKQSTPGIATPDYSVETEVQAYRRLRSAQEKTPASMTAKLIGFAITLALSYVAFGLVFSFNSVFILLAVILFHELGHIAAMYAFKYRDLRILFIPLLGAAATGNKDDVAIWKQVIVYLMGPLPGILAGIGLMALYQQYQAPWLYETAVIMLIINYLNLLPFVPLDGGHIIRLTIMERFPTGKLMFSGLSGIAFAAGAWYLGEPVFWVLAVVMFSSLPWSALEAGLLNELFQQPSQFDQLDKDQKLYKLFETLQQPKFKKLQFVQKFNLVKSLSDVVLHSKHLSRLGSLGLNMVYLSALLLTPPAVFVAALGIDNATNMVAIMSGKIPTRDWEEQIAKAETTEKRFELTLQAAQFHTSTKEFNKAQSYLERAERTFSLINTDNSLAKLYQAYSFYYQGKEEYAQAEDYLNKEIKLYKQLPELNAFNLATSYQLLAAIHARHGKPGVSVTDLKTGLTYALKVEQPEQRFSISAIVSQLLDAYDKDNDKESAFALLQDTLPVLLQHTDVTSNYVTSYLYQELGWLYFSKGETATAAQQFDYALALMTNSAGQNDDAPVDPLTLANLHLALATIHFKARNISIAQTHVETANQLAKENYFDSLGQFIQNAINEAETIASDDNNKQQDNRNHKRWKMIADAVKQIAPEPENTALATAASKGTEEKPSSALPSGSEQVTATPASHPPDIPTAAEPNPASSADNTSTGTKPRKAISTTNKTTLTVTKTSPTLQGNESASDSQTRLKQPNSNNTTGGVNESAVDPYIPGNPTTPVKTQQQEAPAFKYKPVVVENKSKNVDQAATTPADSQPAETYTGENNE